MQIDMQARHFPLSPALRDHAERRLRFTLACCEDYIQRVFVSLEDINGPRGGTDKQCQLQVILEGFPDVVVVDTELDMYVAIDRAVARAGRTVLRRVKRQQTLLRKGGEQPTGELQLR